MELKDITPQIAQVAGSYHYQKPPDALINLQEFISRILRFLFDLLASLHIDVPGLADARTVSGVMQVLLYLAGAASVVILIVIMFSRLGHLNSQSRLARVGTASESQVLNSSGWRNEARLAAEQKQWKPACRALYLSLLRMLDENQIAPYQPSSTNYEYFYLLSALPQVQLDFRQLANIIEEIWFGNRTASAQDYQNCLALLDQVSAESVNWSARAAKSSFERQDNS